MHIVDNGKGISIEDQQKLFVAFGKLPGGDVDNLDGAGMGLTISKRIVEESGGTIDVLKCIFTRKEPGFDFYVQYEDVARTRQQR